MKSLKRNLLLLSLITSLLVIALASAITGQDIPPGAGGENCGKIATSCGGGSGCTPLPISYRPIDIDCYSNCDWTASGNCGTKEWLWFFRRPCGRPLGTDICD